MVVLLPNRTAEPRTIQDQVITGVKVGKYSYGYQHLIDDNGLLAEVGAFCSINPGAKIVPNHPTEFITTHTFLYVNKDVCIPPENVPGIMNPGETLKLHEISKNGKVHIGHDVWIGTDVVIMPGVTIGNGAIIGANAVVTKDIPDYAVAVGVPAKVQRYRFSEEQIRILNEVQWWNWPDEQIKENFKLFGDNEAFFAKFAPVNA
ncbi:CatB-related O-acetyltransferase [Paenibacillus glufosinatiresistens]|uniref:CatB-related O-acetyltransferase n=1 Tax=Paenibacillus glufosinatiresistens TaxID=3070657 RepID=UPI00286E8EF8|nr:CatB-related O-acetyltransferase [Paenibacillus sp. YX.27]